MKRKTPGDMNLFMVISLQTQRVNPQIDVQVIKKYVSKNLLVLSREGVTFAQMEMIIACGLL